MRKTYGPEYPRTLSALMAWSEFDPSGPAVTDSAGTLDRRAFRNRVLCVAGGLRRAGVGPGARVALWLPNEAGYLAAIFACARLGALAIHINTRFRMAEVGNLLRRSRPVAMLMEWGFQPVDFPAIFAALPAQDRAALRCVLGLKVSPSVTQLAGLPVLSLEGPAADPGLDEPTGETPCLTFTTSGTTGGPKLVLHDQQAIAGHATDVARRIGLAAADAALLGAVPFCGTFGNAAAMAAIAGGAHVVCLAQFDGGAGGQADPSAPGHPRDRRRRYVRPHCCCVRRMPFRLGALLRFCRVPFHRRGLDRGRRGVGHAAPWTLRQFRSASAVRGRGGQEPPTRRRRAGKQSGTAYGTRSANREHAAIRRIRRAVDPRTISLHRVSGRSGGNRTRDRR